MEDYKTLEEFPLYRIYNTGRIIRNEYYDSMNKFHKEKELKNILCRDNSYKSYLLDKNLNRKNISIHRLVAMAFIYNDDPVNKIQINHKDGNRLNNNVDNLEWCTQSENIKHSYDVLNHKKVTAITGISEKDEEAKEKIKQTNHCREVRCITTNQIFFSTGEAARQLNVSQSKISVCCSGKIKSVKGLMFEYVNKENYDQKKKVRCAETGEIYESLNKAQNILNISRTSIMECCIGKKKSAHGLHFEFV
jgi:hypothetical protein